MHHAHKWHLQIHTVPSQSCVASVSTVWEVGCAKPMQIVPPVWRGGQKASCCICPKRAQKRMEGPGQRDTLCSPQSIKQWGFTDREVNPHTHLAEPSWMTTPAESNTPEPCRDLSPKLQVKMTVSRRCATGHCPPLPLQEALHQWMAKTGLCQNIWDSGQSCWSLTRKSLADRGDSGAFTALLVLWNSHIFVKTCAGCVATMILVKWICDTVPIEGGACVW